MKTARFEDPTGRRAGKPMTSISIGEWSVSAKPSILSSILGSCVSVCLHDSHRRVGGMNHILLAGTADLHRYNDSARYGVYSMELLINEMMKAGSRRKNLEAKVFGGGHVIPSISQERAPGAKNVAFVMNFLDVEKIPVLKKDVEGAWCRRVYYHTDTFDVFLKRIEPVAMRSVIEEEQRMESTISKRTKTAVADVTLFD